MKKYLMALAIASALMGNAFATEVESSVAAPEMVAMAQTQVAAPALSTVDMQAAFQQDAQPLQVAALTDAEMQATQGAGWWSRFKVKVQNNIHKILAVAVVATCTAMSGGTLATSCTVAVW